VSVWLLKDGGALIVVCSGDLSAGVDRTCDG
jgi:hypothetical protein